jgi:hypothetical protein
MARRDFLRGSIVAGTMLAGARAASGAEPGPAVEPPTIIDTNVTLFGWPFRRLKYGDTAALVAKLRRHRVAEAWAGSFEALFHKDLDGVNTRLARECREKGANLLRPFGAVNLAWPDWEEEVRRCHEGHRMPGIRIVPGYQPFDLGHPELPRLLEIVRQRGLILQVVFGLEDPRVHHPVLKLQPVVVGPLVEALKAVPGARVQVLSFAGNAAGTDLQALMKDTTAAIDISRWESNGIVGKMIGAAPGSRSARVPLERVMFGSHAPYAPVETAVLKLFESPLTADQIVAIMRGNARRLLPAV